MINQWLTIINHWLTTINHHFWCLWILFWLVKSPWPGASQRLFRLFRLFPPCFRLMFQLEDQQIPFFFGYVRYLYQPTDFRSDFQKNSKKSSQSQFMFSHGFPMVFLWLLCPPSGLSDEQTPDTGHRIPRPRKLAKDNKNKPGEGPVRSMDLGIYGNWWEYNI